MIYNWQCANGHQTEVERRLADIDVAPTCCIEFDCPCVPDKRVVVGNKSGVKGFILEGDGWHADCYNRYRSIK